MRPRCWRSDRCRDPATKFAFSPPAKAMTTVDRARRSLVVTLTRSAVTKPDAPPIAEQAAPQAKRRPPPLRVVQAPPAAVEPPIDAAAEDEPRLYLTAEQDVVDAPSIGPKTAARLNAVGIDTVDDLLKAHPIALAARLNDRHFTEETIAEWQDQARLVCAVPGLRGTGAQLLTGAGYRSLESHCRR